MSGKPSTGVLLVNLGTPKDPHKPGVRHYLSEFLMDPRVIDVPWMVRFLLVHAWIVPGRVSRSVAAYQKIWKPQGSPLRIYSEQLKQSVSERLGSDYQVELGMRYGDPCLRQALKRLSVCDRLMILPLFPQYASAVTGSVVAFCLSELSKQTHIPSLNVYTSFYEDPGFIKAYASLIQKKQEEHPADFVLFSYHGLTMRQLAQSCTPMCAHEKTCPITERATQCYRAQCYKTTFKIAEALHLDTNQYATAFQSRLGRLPWIKPYSDQFLGELIARGITNLMVVCPSFVCDCLETLEEVSLRMRAQWQACGGARFTLVPCLNTTPDWIDVLVGWVRTATFS